PTLDPSGMTAIAGTSFPFVDADAGDTLSAVRIGTITTLGLDTPTTYYEPITGHGYELVSGAIGWEAARDAAAAKGGYLAKIDSEAEMLTIAGHFDLGGDSGTDGTWIGAFQPDGSAEPDGGWQWLDGTLLDATDSSPLWNNVAASEPNNAGTG